MVPLSETGVVYVALLPRPSELDMGHCDRLARRLLLPGPARRSSSVFSPPGRVALCPDNHGHRTQQRRRQAADQDSPSKAGICRAGFGNRIAGFRHNRSDPGRCWNAIGR